MKQMHAMAMSGDVDQDFSMMMIHHHEHAIEMSKAQLKYGKDASVRSKAEEIISASGKDIADLKKWQSSQAGMTH